MLGLVWVMCPLLWSGREESIIRRKNILNISIQGLDCGSYYFCFLSMFPLYLLLIPPAHSLIKKSILLAMWLTIWSKLLVNISGCYQGDFFSNVRMITVILSVILKYITRYKIFPARIIIMKNIKHWLCIMKMT